MEPSSVQANIEIFDEKYWQCLACDKKKPGEPPILLARSGKIANVHRHFRAKHPEMVAESAGLKDGPHVGRRAPVLEHFNLGQSRHDPHQCIHCGKDVKSKGTSNLIQHLRKNHPEIDMPTSTTRPTISPEGSPMASGDGRHSPPGAYEEVSPRPTAAVKTGRAKAYYEMAELIVPVKTAENAENLPRAVLKRLQKVNLANTELQNQMLQQQFESEQQQRMIDEMRRELDQLKREVRRGGGGGENGEDVMVFPLNRMQQVDEVEERIAADPEFRERLSDIFRSGEDDKTNSIVEWLSNEVLIQFTHKSDWDSLTTHRSTEFSEMFQLMFSTWSDRGFNKDDFQTVVKEVIENATQVLAVENYNHNKRKRKADAAFETEAGDHKIYIRVME